MKRNDNSNLRKKLSEFEFDELRQYFNGISEKYLSYLKEVSHNMKIAIYILFFLNSYNCSFGQKKCTEPEFEII